MGIIFIKNMRNQKGQFKKGERSGEKNPFFGRVHTDKTRKRMKEAWEKRRLTPTSEETRKKMSVARKGRKFTEEHKRKLGEARKRWSFTEETKEKIRKTLTGRKLSSEHVEKIRFSSSGRKHTEETRKKMSKAAFNLTEGKNNGTWTKKDSRRFKKTLEYRLWREAVFRRDDSSCKKCGAKEKIEAHHIKPFKYHPELRTVVENGETLCHGCHKKTDTYGRRIASYAVREGFIIT